MRNKPLGELGEASFHVRALREGLVISKPYGDSAKYDFVAEANGKLSRVQIKATSVRVSERKHNYYRFSVCHGRKTKNSYSGREVDYIICYVVPEDVWYVFPVEELSEVITVKVRPWSSEAAHPRERYKEAWHLLQ